MRIITILISLFALGCPEFCFAWNGSFESAVFVDEERGFG